MSAKKRVRAVALDGQPMSVREPMNDTLATCGHTANWSGGLCAACLRTELTTVTRRLSLEQRADLRAMCEGAAEILREMARGEREASRRHDPPRSDAKRESMKVAHALDLGAEALETRARRGPLAK